MKRPWYVTAFCVVGWFWLFIIFPEVISPETKKVHILLPSLYVIIIAFLFIALVGIWHLKKWGLELFFILLFIKNYVDNSAFKENNYEDAFSYNISLGFLFFLIYGIIIAIAFYRKMSKEL